MANFLASEIEIVHSCYPTSLLNGWIFQQFIEPEEAGLVRDYLTRHTEWFSLAHSGPVSYWGFHRNPLALSESILNKTGKFAPQFPIDLGRLEDPEAFLARQFRTFASVVGGDRLHAVLGARHFGEQVEIIDPVDPEQPIYKTLAEFTQLCLEEGWVSIIPVNIHLLHSTGIQEFAQEA